MKQHLESMLYYAKQVKQLEDNLTRRGFKRDDDHYQNSVIVPLKLMGDMIAYKRIDIDELSDLNHQLIKDIRNEATKLHSNVDFDKIYHYIDNDLNLVISQLEQLTS